MVFEPLLKMKLTIPIVINTLSNCGKDLVKITPFYKKAASDKQSKIIPSEFLTAANIKMFLSALKTNCAANQIPVRKALFKEEWEKIFEISSEQNQVTAEKFINSLKGKSNLLFVSNIKIDTDENTGQSLPESE